jgi:hypothetical protein
MIFKYFKDQIYLIIYLIFRKLKSKTSCCLHYFGDGFLGCYKTTCKGQAWGASQSLVFQEHHGGM